MDSKNINIYVSVAIFCTLVVVIILVTFGLFFCLEEKKKREIQKREKYLRNINSFVVATSTLVDATTRVSDL